MAAHFNDIWVLLALHRNAVDHEEVWVAKSSIYWTETVVVILCSLSLLHCESNVQRLLVPATEQHDLVLVDWNCPKVTNLVWHLD
jgi:hypothetical protein